MYDAIFMWTGFAAWGTNLVRRGEGRVTGISITGGHEAVFLFPPCWENVGRRLFTFEHLTILIEFVSNF
jgi:hypothetical protein